MFIADDFRNKILPLRSQLAVRNHWLKQRLDEVIPELMDRERFDMWLVIAREYNEDPVIMTLLPEPAMSARRRTILMFHRKDDGTVERLTMDRYGHGEFYQRGWDPDQEDQYTCLARTIRERNPQTIGINISDTFAFGDGLSHTEYRCLEDALGSEYMQRVRSAERLCVGWLERRIDDELVVYPDIVAIGHAIIAQAFSNRVIHPGITTTDDVVWWMRQTMQSMGLRAWFQPNVDIQAPGVSYEDKTDKRKVIMPGDLLWCDVGFYYLGLATDQQQHAYVLKPGEKDAPDGLKLALADGNQLQDILMEEMRAGKTGNEVLKATLDRAKSKGINPSVYSHPLGYHGHAAGPTIGLWDRQDGVPGSGDYEIFEQTVYSVELNVKRQIKEWDGQEVRIALEEDAVFVDGSLRWLSGRQTAYHLIS